MKYDNVVSGKFIARPNRFIAHVEINGRLEVVHVKNTGRCRELLIPGCKVYLSVADNPERKTKYDLIAVEKDIGATEPLLVNMDSQLPNAVTEEWLKRGGLFPKDAVIKREYTYGKSRIDFYIEEGKRKILMEVKGCTLENDGVASFPDAPTERGVRHIKELQNSLAEGYEAYILFVIQMKNMKVFKPNDATHKAFGDSLREAVKAGVKVIAYECLVKPDSIAINKEVKVDFN